MRIIGIDPGTRIMGFACISKTNASKQNTIGIIENSFPRSRGFLKDFHLEQALALKANAKLPIQKRLCLLHEKIYELINHWQPDIVVLEKAFIGVNSQTGIKLGEARGIIMAAAGRNGIEINELAPTTVKKTITGHGLATKEQISRALVSLVGFEKGNLPFDVTDALAIALTFGLQLNPCLGSGHKKSRKNSWATANLKNLSIPT